MESKTTPRLYEFTAVMENPEKNIDAAFVSFPYDVKKEFKSKGLIKVKVTFDGHPYRGVLSPMGAAHHLILVKKEIRKAIGKQVGDSVKVTVQEDLEERVLEIPAEMNTILKKHPTLKKFFEGLSYTNRKEYVLWITSAKKEETKQNRLNLIVEKLKAGKKNPSEK